MPTYQDTNLLKYSELKKERSSNLKDAAIATEMGFRIGQREAEARRKAEMRAKKLDTNIALANMFGDVNAISAVETELGMSPGSLTARKDEFQSDAKQLEGLMRDFKSGKGTTTAEIVEQAFISIKDKWKGTGVYTAQEAAEQELKRYEREHRDIPIKLPTGEGGAEVEYEVREKEALDWYSQMNRTKGLVKIALTNVSKDKQDDFRQHASKWLDVSEAIAKLKSGGDILQLAPFIQTASGIDISKFDRVGAIKQLENAKSGYENYLRTYYSAQWGSIEKGIPSETGEIPDWEKELEEMEEGSGGNEFLFGRD